MAIYFIEMEGLNLLKIGFTDRDPQDRLRELQTANPHKLNLLLVQAGGLKQEAGLHQAFAHLQAQGEWFRFTPELQAYIAVARFVFPRLNEMEDRLEKCRARVEWLTDQIDGEGEFGGLKKEISELSERLDRIIDKVEIGHPDGPPAWQGEIDDLRGLIHARIKH